ncbi:hypothetical protein Salat_1101700 [Sesamum alatum]|uniref:Zinc knuckle CX2CX4HX4C domain-containing protein n=1 Tax=Sesamum alatum TaxID=300844 RepID=A0AAE1YMZ9_9LAMI|nr:hypothetical protein Salat_1101700 [Sesamum alatum]
MNQKSKFSPRQIHTEALKSTLASSFNPVKGMDFRMIDGNRFLHKFHHTIDRDRVVEGAPLALNKNLLVLHLVGENENPVTVNLDHCDFYIHVYNLPVGKMTKEMAAFIGDKIGIFRNVGIDSDGVIWGSNLRIPVSINVTKPLPRVLKIISVFRDEIFVTFKYGSLPNFCYLYGMLGHLSKACELCFEPSFSDLSDNNPMGLG